MANDKNFKIKNGLLAGRYLLSSGTATSGAEGYAFSSASYTNNSLDLGADVGASPSSIRWKPDGLKLFVYESANDAIFSLTLTTAYDLSTATVDGTSYTFFSTEVGSDDGTTFHIGANGSKLYIPEDPGSPVIHQYTLSTPWDLGSESFDGSLDLTSDPDMTYGTGAINFKTDGTRVYIYANFSLEQEIFQFDLATAWDITSTRSNKQILDLSGDLSGQGSSSDIHFTPDGLSFVVSSTGLDQLLSYTMTTAWDVTTATLSHTFDTSSLDGSPRSTGYNSDGTKLFFVGLVSDSIFELDTSLPTQTLDLSTGNTFSFTPSGATTVSFTNAPASGTAVGFTVEVVGDGSAITWPSSVEWHLGTAPTATASKELYAFVTTDGGTTYYGRKAAENLA